MLRRIGKNKKGQLIDGFSFIILLFIAAIVFSVYAYVFPTIATALNGTGINVNNETQLAIDNLNDMGTTGLNQGFIILFGGLILVQFATAFLVRNHPIFIVIYFFFLIFNSIMAIYLGNVFDDLSSISLIQQSLQSQTVVGWVWDNILIIQIVIDVLTMIILFAKVGEAPSV